MGSNSNVVCIVTDQIYSVFRVPMHSTYEKRHAKNYNILLPRHQMIITEKSMNATLVLRLKNGNESGMAIMNSLTLNKFYARTVLRS